MRRTFFFKSLLRYSVCILIPILLLGTLSLVLTTQYIQKQVETNNINTLNQVKERLDNLFIDVQSLNVTISSNATLVYTIKKILNDPANSISMESNIVLNTLVDFLGMKSTANQSMHSIYIYFENDTGKFISSTERISDIGTFYDQGWYGLYRDTLNNGDIWTKPRTVKQYSFEQDPPIVSVFQKLLPMNLQIGGVLVANISADYINRMLNERSSPESQVMFIADRKNRVLFHNAAFTSVGDDILKSITKNGTRGNFFGIVNHNQSYAISRIYSEATELYYVSAIPSNELYRLPQYILYITFALLILSFLFAIYFAYRGAQKNYSHIASIIDTLNAAKEGKPLPDTLPESKDVYSLIISDIIRTFLQYDLMRVQLSEKKYQNQALELQALQSQMNPHFLFNTLGTIYWKSLSLTGKPNEATSLIENLSDIMRYSLNNRSATVPLREEIQNTRSYISIQKVRHQSSFDVIWQVDDHLYDCRVLKLLIQPFIENSLKHGLHHPEKMTIKIKIHPSADGGGIQIHITDNGLGIEPQRLQTIQHLLVDSDTSTGHIGLFNTNKRIKLAYGDHYGIRLISKYRYGTSVMIHLPISEHSINRTG